MCKIDSSVILMNEIIENKNLDVNTREVFS